MPQAHYHSAERVRALNDRHGWRWPRYEAVQGELLVTPAPRFWHQEVVGRLAFALRQYLDREPVGRVVCSPADISWAPDTLVQPDVFVVPTDQARTMDWRRMTQLLLAVEVLSPSSVRADRFAKRRLYQEHGVSLYWVVDPDGQTVECWTPADLFPRTEREIIEWHPDGASGPFSLPLAELFRPL